MNKIITFHQSGFMPKSYIFNKICHLNNVINIIKYKYVIKKKNENETYLKTKVFINGNFK